MRRFRPGFGALAGIAVVGAAILVAAVFAPPPAVLRGAAQVLDGDTLRIAGTRIRLLGIDAPEHDQPCTHRDGTTWACGEAAKAFAIGLAAHRTVTCTSTGRDRYGRALARCETDAGDLAEAIVANGWAVAELPYAAAEAEARAKGLGIWSGIFVSPADWRRDHGQGLTGLWDWIASWFQ